MDYLRSCYSTKMVMDPSGTQYDVTWYFCDPTAPLFTTEHFASLNWTRPQYGTNPLGEVGTVPRLYNKGKRPSWINPSTSWTSGGLADWYVHGAPAPRLSPPTLVWDGSRTFPGDNPAGIFPPPTPLFTAVRLASSVSGNLTQVGVALGVREWQFNPDRNLALIDWINPGFPFFTCYPSTLALVWHRAVPPQGGVLRCTSYNSGTGVSVWDDPHAGILAAGETLTLYGV